MTDFDILKANMRFGAAKGARIQIQKGAAKGGFEREAKKRKLSLSPIIHVLFRNRAPAAELTRNIMWRGKKYRSAELLGWLDEYKPEAVFFQGSSMAFLYKIVLWICERYDAKLLLQLTDDYTYVRLWFSPISWINHAWYMKWFKKGLARAQTVFAISPAMKAEYEHLYGHSNIRLAANSTELFEMFTSVKRREPLCLTYAGNILLSRLDILRLIGEALRELHGEGLHGILTVYTPKAASKKQEKILTLPPCLSYGGSLNPAQLAEAYENSDILVHVESFHRRQKKVTRLSLSTKIPEYLARGKCILAVGPEDIASIRYLKETDAALVITEKEKQLMRKQLKQLFDKQFRARASEAALAIARQNHDRARIQNDIAQLINN